MNCENYLFLIDDLTEGELDELNALQVNSHLHNCLSCSAYYETLRKEKDIYAHYLFDIEPPKDFWAIFQAKLGSDSGTFSQISETPILPGGWKTYIPEFFRFCPVAVGFTAALIVAGVGFSVFRNNETATGEEYTARKVENPLQIYKQPEEINQYPSKPLPENDLPTTLNNLPKTKSLLNRKTVYEITNSSLVIKTTKRSREAIETREKLRQPTRNQANEEQKSRQQLSELEEETAQQIEKTEMLLRSFRNARVVEGGSAYDVEYEKQQARSLLAKNVRLRQIAENYGTLYTREILNKVEPFLLDIANLDDNSAAEKVLDIKERVKNQNIIASLQVY